MPPSSIERLRAETTGGEPPRRADKKLRTPPGDDRLRFSGSIAVPSSPPIDPASNGVRILVETASGSAIIDRTIPGGLEWRANRAGTKWRYQSAAMGSDTIQVILKGKPRKPGALRFIVIGKNGSFPVETSELPLKGTVVIDSPLAIGGQCGEAPFPSAAVGRCVFSVSGGTLKCR